MYLISVLLIKSNVLMVSTSNTELLPFVSDDSKNISSPQCACNQSFNKKVRERITAPPIF